MSRARTSSPLLCPVPRLLFACPSSANLTSSPLLFFSLRPSSIDLSFVDYDSTRFHLSTPTSKRIIQLSMSIRCWPDLVRYGVDQTIQREFGEWVSDEGVEEGFNVTLKLDMDKIPEEGGTSACFLTSPPSPPPIVLPGFPLPLQHLSLPLPSSIKRLTRISLSPLCRGPNGPHLQALPPQAPSPLHPLPPRLRYPAHPPPSDRRRIRANRRPHGNSLPRGRGDLHSGCA